MKIKYCLRFPERIIYSFDLKNVVPSKELTCLFAKAINDESNLWYKRLGHINFKTINKLVKENLVRGLPLQIFENDHTCVACQKGKQHKASCKSKLVNSVSQPLQILRMDLFGPTFIKSIMGKIYFLVVTDDYSRFSWVSFLAKKDESSEIFKYFITGIENQLNHKVNIIRCDNETEFKNYKMNQFYRIKGIKRKFSNAKTPQQNRVAKRKNKTLIEAARSMLVDSLLPIPNLAESVNIACYVRNRVLVTKPHNKTPYELLIGRTPIISFMRPFSCPVTFLNTLNHLKKFNGKADERFLVGYSINSKAFRVYNSRTKKVEENLHVNFLKNKPNVAGSGQEGKEKVSDQEYILLPVLNSSSDVPSSNEEVLSSPKDDAGKKSTIEPTCIEGGKIDDLECLDQQKKSVDDSENTNSINTVSPTVNTASDKDGTFQRTYGKWNFLTLITVNTVGSSFSHPAALDDFSKMPNLEDTRIFDDAYDDRDEGAEADKNNMEQWNQRRHWWIYLMEKRAIGTEWVYRNKRDHRGIVVRNKARLVAQGHRQEECIDYDEVFALVARIKAIRLFLAYASFMDFTVYQNDVKSAFLYRTIEEEVYVSQPPGFMDPEFPYRVYNVEKALYALHQALRAWYETLSNYLLENGFRRGTIDKTLFIKKIKNDILLVQVYVDDIIFGSTKRSLSTEFKQLIHNRFQMSSIGELTFFLGLQVKQRKDGIFLSQDKYACDILKKFGFSSVKLASTPMETHKPLSKDSDGTDIHVDNESAICVVKNPVYHSKTKHNEIKHHFIRDSYKKRLIEMVKIHTDSNVADLLTKAFDVTRLYILDTWNGVQEWSSDENGTNILQDICLMMVMLIWCNMLVIELILPVFSILDFINTTNGHQVTMSNRQKRIGYSRANGNCIEQFWNTTSSKTINFVKQIHAIVNGKAVVISESLVRSTLLFDDEDGITCLTNDENFENLALMGYEPLSTKLTFQKGNVTPLFDTMLVQHQAPEGEGIDTGGSPRHQEIMGGTFAQTMSERVLEQPNEPPLTEGHTSGSGDGRLEENIELMDTIPTPYDSPLTGGYTPGSDEVVYNKDFITLTNRVKKLESVQKTAKHSRDDDDDDETLAETLMNIKRSSTKVEAKAQGDSNKEVEELKLYMIIIPKEDIAIEAIPLSIKPLVIIKEDLETLWKLVKDKYGNTRPGEGYERVLWEDLKVMFEPDIESEIQKSAHLPAGG
nr:hypothetical protein [Tanacetum cinerariifolium]